MELCSFDDDDAIARAVAAAKDGKVVGAHFGTVFGLIVDGSHQGVADDIMRIKGAARGRKPLGVCLPPGRLTGVIDLTSLSPRLLELASSPWFAERLAAMVAVRAPLSPAAGVTEPLHSQIDGVGWVQVFDPTRMPGASILIAAMWEAGVRWVAVTSMNESGRTEIVDLDDAVGFARRHGLPMLFEATAVHSASGSLPILDLAGDRLRLDRHGIIAVADLEAATGEHIEVSESAASAHFPPMPVPRELLDGLAPAEAAEELLELLYPAV